MVLYEIMYVMLHICNICNITLHNDIILYTCVCICVFPGKITCLKCLKKLLLEQDAL